jgi:MFS family permease
MRLLRLGAREHTPDFARFVRRARVGCAAMAPDRVSARDWSFLALLTVLNVMNFVDRQLLGSFANFIVPDLGLSPGEFGLLTGLAFLLFYATMGLFTGALADRVNRPRLVALGLALWSGLTAASGAARGFLSLALPRALIGVGESVLTPASMSMLADRFPASRLGVAAGIYYMGVPVGSGVSLLIAGYLGPAIGWRACFYALGALGLVFAVVMLRVRDPARRHVAKGPVAPAQPFSASVRTLLSTLRASPALVYTMTGGVAVHFVLGAASFDQLWLVQERGFERAEIAQISGWIGIAGGILGNLLGGFGSDWWRRRFASSRPVFLFWLLIAFSPLGLVYRLAPGDSPWLLVGLFAGYVQLGAFYGPTFATVQELAPPQIRATAVALYILLLNLAGVAIGNTAGGYVVEALEAGGASAPYSTMLIVFTLISMCAIPFFWVAGRALRPQQAR